MFKLITAESLAIALLVLVAGFLVVLFTTDSFRTRHPGQRDSGFQLFAKRRHRRGPVLGLLLLLLALPLGYLVWRQVSAPAAESAPADGVTVTEVPAPVTGTAGTGASVVDVPAVIPAEAASPVAVVDPTTEVTAAIEAWRAAWTARDVEPYLAAYAADFQPADGQTLDAWRTQRKDRLRKARGIRVEIEQLSVDADGDRATARFMQRYRAGSVSDRVWKRLVLSRTPEGWKITEEAVDGAKKP